MKIPTASRNPFLTASLPLACIALAIGLAATSASAGTQYWSGAGTWNTGLNWGAVSGGPYNAAWNNAVADFAVFEGTGGEVVVGASRNADGLTFNVTGYSLTATAPVTITGSSGTTHNLAANVTATIGANVTLQSSNTAQSWTIKGASKTTSILNLEGVIQNGTTNASSLLDSTVNVKTGGELIGLTSIITGTATTGSGSALNVAGTVTISDTASSLILNNTSGITADSSITLSDGGNITFTNTGNTNGIRFGPTGSPTPIVNTSATQLTGTFNLNGGTATVNKIFVGGTYSGGAVYNSYVNLNGGTLKALRDQVDFMEGLTSAKVQAGGAIFDTNGKNITVSQALIADSASGGLEKKGGGILTLDSAGNTYTGITTVTTGVLRITNANALGATGATARTSIVGNESTSRLELSGGISTGETFQIGMRTGAALNAPALSNFSGNNTVTGDIQGVTGGSRINIESQADLLTLAGSLSQTSGTGNRTWQLMGAGNGLVSGVISNGTATDLGISKSGAGTWTFSNANTYTGTTTVNAGTLALTGTGSIADSANLKIDGTLDVSGITASTFTVGTSQTLSGDGTVNATGKTVSIEGTHAVGSSPGQQDITGNLNYASASIFEWDLNAGTTDPGENTANSGTYDQVAVTGDLTGTGSVFKIVLGGTDAFIDAFWNTHKTWSNIFTAGNSYDLGTIFTTFSGTEVDSAGLVAGRGTFTLSGSTLNWTAVPEPTSALAGLLLTAGLLRRRRARA